VGTPHDNLAYLCLREEDPPLPPLSQGELHGLGVGHGACPQTRHARVQTVTHVRRRRRTAHQAGYCKTKIRTLGQRKIIHKKNVTIKFFRFGQNSLLATWIRSKDASERFFPTKLVPFLYLPKYHNIFVHNLKILFYKSS
jgi:hypothetical protein